MRVEIATLRHRGDDVASPLDMSAVLMAIGANMRQADRDEVAALAACSAATGLARSVLLSHDVYAGLVDGVPACLFGLGVGDALAGIARPWLLGTPCVDAHAVAFLRRNRGVLAQWWERWPCLENWVDARNTRSIRWLRWLGFMIHDAAPFGAFGFPFHRFELRR